MKLWVDLIKKIRKQSTLMFVCVTTIAKYIVLFAMAMKVKTALDFITTAY
jgi:hypothetical protein